MINYKIKSILLIFILVLGFSGNVDIFEKYGNSISNVSHVKSINPIQLAFAESDSEKDSGSSDKSSEQDNSNNTAGNESPSNSEHQSENNGLQFNESNQTQTMHEGENKDTKELDKESENKTSEHQQESENKTSEHQQESENKTSEHQQELDQESEIENERNNINATHVMTERDISNIEGAKANETIAAEINVGIGNVEHKSIDNNVMVQTANVTSDSVAITVNATSGTGPKVILFNLNSTTIDVSSINSMHVLYDGHPITPAANIDEIMHATSSDPPRYAILITQSGAQILISIPHFSTHTITLANMSKVIPAVPEFGPVVGIVSILSTISVVIISRKVKFHLL